MSQYSEAMSGIVNFSIVSLENWHMAPNSVHYVLGFWERLIKGIPYSNCEKRDHNLNLYSPQIMQAYIKVKRMGAMLWPRLCLGPHNSRIPPATAVKARLCDTCPGRPRQRPI